MKKFITILVRIIIVILIGICCFFKKEEKSTLTKVKVAEVTHSIFYTPMYVSHALGYFEDENLDVEIILTSGADAVASAVLSNDVQIGFCGSDNQGLGGIEAKYDDILNGEKGKKEILSKRSAVYLYDDEEQVLSHYEKIKRIYKKRSDFVHDGKYQHIDTDDIVFLRQCLRTTILKLLDDGKIQQYAGNGDHDQILPAAIHEARRQRGKAGLVPQVQ